MTDERNQEMHQADASPTETEKQALQSRRDFLIGLGKWSRVVVAGAVLGAGVVLTDKPAQAGWLNRRGYGYGGSGWLNNRGGGGWWNQRGGLGWLNGR